MQDENTVNTAFYLAVLENSLDVIAFALRVASATSTSDRFHLNEAPIALEEARSALINLKNEHIDQSKTAPEAA